MVQRVYVEKKAPFALEARSLLAELQTALGLAGLQDLRIVQRYDIEGADVIAEGILGEPPVDNILKALPEAEYVCAVEFLPGQFDQRADSAAQCIALVTGGERPVVKSAKIYLFYGTLDTAVQKKIDDYLINPVEARKADLAPVKKLTENYPEPPDIPILDDFMQLSDAEIPEFIKKYRFAMDADDLKCCRAYFKTERRPPTLTELRVIDTYWSDHCRHTTFGTILDTIDISDAEIAAAYQNYLDLRREVYGESPKPVSLMDMATIGAKALHRRGKLSGWDISEEINACSIKAGDWLLLFKNETHNHPTEIEPFGGAATCIGGAIRDPLSGRAYVYHAMRITGAGDISAPLETTLPGKLPQRKIAVTAAAGFSSYGNQIGVATGFVREFYHPGYLAKRMELGAVVGAVPAKNVRREKPVPGDIVLLLGGRTGRDGCGGATGSSKAHTAESLLVCGAEVQKGNAPVERALQRLFRNAEAARLIKRCNDFGAGGVAVAIGELADGLVIDLDAVPRKYEGLDGTELAISESQERMAVVVDAENAPLFQRLAGEENLESAAVARVIAEPVMSIRWRGREIVRLSRAFLASNGVEKHAVVKITPPVPGFWTDYNPYPAENSAGSQHSVKKMLETLAADLNFCSNKGLAERFDSTIGAATVLMPFGGKQQLTPVQLMCAKLPAEDETTVCSGLAAGFNPFLAEKSPFHGAYSAVIHSAAKLIAAGFEREQIYLSFQEYFERLGSKPERWGKPAAALLGALTAQIELEIAAIGGKDSMSGSFENLDVPPALLSFACAAGDVRRIISPEFKTPGNTVILLRAGRAKNKTDHKALFNLVETWTAQKKIHSAWVLEYGGLAGALFKMCLGNRLGFTAAPDGAALMSAGYDAGTFVCEVSETALAENDKDLTGDIERIQLGQVHRDYVFECGNEKIQLDKIQEIYENRLEEIMPYRFPAGKRQKEPEKCVFLPQPAVCRPQSCIHHAASAPPRALVPVFPGSNCEYDTLRALRRAGAEAEICIIRSRTPYETAESEQELAKKIALCQMLVLPGGFSGADEPDGSAKLIVAFFRAAAVRDAVMELLEVRDGLILGICNGFQALVKLGLVPFGKILDIKEEFPTLTFNTIGRHQSMMTRTKIVSMLSPWFLAEKPGAIHTIPVSHGEGRFIANEAVLQELAMRGQIACQYVDPDGMPTMDIRYNPAGSIQAVEAISSPCGRVLGKMAHSERAGNWLYKNIPGNTFQKIFEGGVEYFS